MKALLIDSAAREVRTVQYSNTKDLEKLIQADMFTIAWTWPNGDVLFVDDEGLSKPQRHFFRLALRSDDQPLAGNGVVVGAEQYDDDGNYTATDDPAITAEELAQLITFMTREQADAWAKGNASEPAVIVAGDVVERYGNVFDEMPKPLRRPGQDRDHRPARSV